MKSLLKNTTIFLSGACVAIAGTAFSMQAMEGHTAKMIFPDVEEQTYFGPSVTKMARTGIVRGYDSGNFGPNDTITRAQATVMIDRYDEKVVQPLRKQLQAIRKELRMGDCGDGDKQNWEECDDGNRYSGDGCNEHCLEEVQMIAPQEGFCEYDGEKYAVGDGFPAEDGCNKCFCGENGTIGCTRMACPDKPRISCTYNGREYKIGESFKAEDGCNTCRCGEFGEVACTEMWCDTMSECGNGICEAGEQTECFEYPCPEGKEDCMGTCRKGTCPKDCEEEIQENKDYRCGTYNYDNEKKEVCAVCGDGKCESHEHCISSHCSEGGCTDDCGPLYCPEDCEE